MAATGFTPIKIYASSTASSVPLAANLDNTNGAELAINTADGRLFYKDSSGVVQTMASKATGAIGGSTTQIQFNNAGALGGSASLTWNGTVLTSSGFAGPLNGTVGATTPAAGAFTTLTTSSTITDNGGTANGVTYLNGSKVVTSGSALTFDGTNLSSTGGATFLGSPSGFGGGEVRLGPTTADTQSAISTQSTGSPQFIFDHRGTSNTGSYIWRNGSGGANELMRLTSTGLGIGTSSPARKLDVNGTVRIADGQSVEWGGTSLYIAGTSNTFLFGTSGTERMRIDSSGNVGIGTSSPGGNSTNRIVKIQGSSSAQAQVSDGTTTASLGVGGATGYVEVAGANPLLFYTNGSERARIDSSGNLLVGTTASLYSIPNGVAMSGSGIGAIVVGHINGTSSGNGFINFNYNGGVIGSITQNGTTGVLYNLTSDYRLKNDQQPLTGAKDFVMALQPKKWQWWDGSGEGVGFIAHEFMEVAKYSGHGEKDAVDENGNIIPQSIQPSSSEVMANLVAFIQEQQALIQDLQTRLAALEAK